MDKFAFIQKLNLVWVCFIVVLGRGSLAPAQNFDFELADGLQKTYIYQRNDMREVNWLYIGYVPRMEDPDRISITISKGGYTMRANLRMTEQDVAEYPEYLIRRAQTILKIMNDNRVQIYQADRFQKYLDTIQNVSAEYNAQAPLAERYAKGLSLLKKFYPQNIFESPQPEGDGTVLQALFVYPITINKAGPNWPADNIYIQAHHYPSPFSAIEERRTDHADRKAVDEDGDGKSDRVVRVVKDYIFSGFPAFWLDSSGKGTGVHGPIRFSRLNEQRGYQAGPYGRTPDKMLKFWSENEFLGHENDIKHGLEQISLRWDVVRTNNSQGCFRAETMELRHLLPADKNAIYKRVHWKVISALDEVVLVPYAQPKKVDINYYMVNPYRFPQKREEWVSERILTLNERKSPQKEDLIKNFIENSIQFPYLDPSIVEFSIGDGFNEEQSRRIMTKFNQAGGMVGSAQTWL